MIKYTHYVSYSKFISKDKILEFFANKGYSVITMTRLLKRELGYRNASHITSETGLKNGVLRLQLVYKDEVDYADLVKKVSTFVRKAKDYLEHGRTGRYRYRSNNWYALTETGVDEYITTNKVCKMINECVDENLNNLS